MFRYGKSKTLALLCIILTLSILPCGCVSGNPESKANEIAVKTSPESARPSEVIPTTAAQTGLDGPQKSTGPVEINLVPGSAFLTNPGIGWQASLETGDITSFLETVAYSNRSKIAWSVLNPARDVFDWGPLDAQIESAKKAGKQFSFRVYTMVGEGFGGAKVPAWVIEEGAKIRPSGDPDYSNCTYQLEWGRFVNELIRVYDGNPDIAFIDISGYGNFNEWSWQDGQTEWDIQWADDYSNGTASNESFFTLDGQARRRLVDTFIGGSFDGHSCRTSDEEIYRVDYTYPGFQKTQLVMPYAGIIQSSQYLLTRRSDVGFRYDCLGRDGKNLYARIEDLIRNTWKNAPVVYELCKPEETSYEDAAWLLQNSHASIVHNNNWSFDLGMLKSLMLPVGYRYAIKNLTFAVNARQVKIDFEWQNYGLAPSYPRMGQDFHLYICFQDESGEIVYKAPVPADISTWLPAETYGDEPPVYPVSYLANLPGTLAQGIYQVGVRIEDSHTGLPILLAIEPGDTNGIYFLFSMEVK